jgi:hypothetical protein
MGKAEFNKGSPSGRKREGWKKEYFEMLHEVAKDLGEISEEEISRAVRTYRRERRAPDLTVTPKATDEERR